VREGLAGRFAGMPAVHYGEALHRATDDTGLSTWTITGTTAAGQKVRALGCDVCTFRDGLVVLKDSYWKMVEPCGG